MKNSINYNDYYLRLCEADTDKFSIVESDGCKHLQNNDSKHRVNIDENLGNIESELWSFFGPLIKETVWQTQRWSSSPTAFGLQGFLDNYDDPLYGVISSVVYYYERNKSRN